jgi:RNA polymerase sigma-70 factor (TIGR02960 family)
MHTTDANDFAVLVAPFRAELHAYCYRMLGSLQDAEDALQEAMLGAWKGLPGFGGRSALRSWLYRVATNACLRVIGERPPRLLPAEYSGPSTGIEVDPMVDGPLWVEPYPDPVGSSYEMRESVELAFVSALQHLPATQRAALILRQVLGFTAAEVAELLDTTVPSITSAEQRARETLDRRAPAPSQQATLRDLGADAERALVASFVTAWGRGDVSALVELLARDARFGMPPIPTWFQGRDAVARFFAERVFATPWRLVPLRASGQLAFACYQGPEFRLGALNVVTVRDHSICEMTGFLDPAVHAHFGLSDR